MSDEISLINKLFLKILCPVVVIKDTSNINE